MPTKAKRTAVGIPDRSNYGNPSNIPVRQLLPYVLQLHVAARAGRHYDLRFGPNELYSWAVPKGLPTRPGQSRLAIYQPLHEGQYAEFEGTIPKGEYGAGKVRTADKGYVYVIENRPGKIRFAVVHKKYPEFFTLIRKDDKNWLLVNTTPSEVIEHKKVHYTKVPVKDVEKLFDPNYLISEKIDGSAALIKLFKDKIEVLSYRASKSGKPIVHTLRIDPKLYNLRIPKKLRGTILRGEIWGERGGKAIPPQELGGILNASVAKAIRKKEDTNTKLRVALFNLLRYGNRPITMDEPYEERLKKLREALKVLPTDTFHLPKMVPGEQGKELWEQIVKGRNPVTREGIVAWPLSGGKPAKAKLVDEHDVIIKKIFPGQGKYKGIGAGGFWYAHPENPDVIVGKVGTGFSDELRKAMLQNPDEFIGRIARIRAQGKFPRTGAYRAPRLIALHEDYPLAKRSSYENPQSFWEAIWVALWNWIQQKLINPWTRGFSTPTLNRAAQALAQNPAAQAAVAGTKRNPYLYPRADTWLGLQSKLESIGKENPLVKQHYGDIFLRNARSWSPDEIAKTMSKFRSYIAANPNTPFRVQGEAKLDRLKNLYYKQLGRYVVGPFATYKPDIMADFKTDLALLGPMVGGVEFGKRLFTGRLNPRPVLQFLKNPRGLLNARNLRSFAGGFGKNWVVANYLFDLFNIFNQTYGSKPPGVGWGEHTYRFLTNSLPEQQITALRQGRPYQAPSAEIADIARHPINTLARGWYGFTHPVQTLMGFTRGVGTWIKDVYDRKQQEKAFQEFITKARAAQAKGVRLFDHPVQ